MKLIVIALTIALVIVSAATCGPRISLVWPVSPDVARASSFDLLTTHADRSTQHGTAWIVDRHHLITAASQCDANGKHEIAAGHQLHADVIGRQVHADVIGPKLCLLSSASELGYPLIIANVTPRNWRKSMYVAGYESPVGAAVVATWHDDDPWGDPLDTRSGVIGLQLDNGKYVGLRGLKGFLSHHHVDWHDEPDFPQGPGESYSEQQGVGVDDCSAPGDLCSP